MSFRGFRILVLLGVLAAALGMTWIEQTLVQSWRAPLDVALYPINGDGSEAATETIRTLRPEDFAGLNAFLERETRRYGVRRSPAMTLSLQPEMGEAPPTRPQGGNVLQTMLWSLKLRWWSYRHAGTLLPQIGKIRLYVLFHRPEDGVALEHSLGLQKGLIGVMHVFASEKMQAKNQVVIAHELLHTLGATDKYDPADNQPRFPAGYAEPYKEPLHPQFDAEIMAGRIALSEVRASMPESLDRCVIGAATAHEINFAGGFASQYRK
jgi:hypothetical protein